MKCKYCGTENVDGALYCGNCGAVVEKEEMSVQTPPVVGPSIQPEHQATQVHAQKPASSSKKWIGVAIAAAVVAVVGVAVLLLNNAYGWFDFGSEPETEPVLGEESLEDNYQITNLRLGDKAIVDSLLELTLNECSWEEELYASNKAYDLTNTPVKDIEGEKYIVIRATITNKSADNIDINHAYVEYFINNQDAYSASIKTYVETDGGRFLSDHEKIRPQQTSTVYFVCSVSDSVYSNTKSLSFSIGFDKEFSQFPSNAGFDMCDYVFKASFSKN